MKKLWVVSSLILAVATVGYAADKHSASVTIYDTVHAGATVLPPGDYSLVWQDGSGDIMLSISGNHKKVSLPVTITSRPDGPTSAKIHADGSEMILEGFQVKTANITLKPADPAVASAGGK